MFLEGFVLGLEVEKWGVFISKNLKVEEDSMNGGVRWP